MKQRMYDKMTLFLIIKYKFISIIFDFHRQMFCVIIKKMSKCSIFITFDNVPGDSIGKMFVIRSKIFDVCLHRRLQINCLRSGKKNVTKKKRKNDFEYNDQL